MKKILNKLFGNMNTESFIIIIIVVICLIVFLTSVKVEPFETHRHHREGEDIRKYRMKLHGKHKSHLTPSSYFRSENTFDKFHKKP